MISPERPVGWGIGGRTDFLLGEFFLFFVQSVTPKTIKQVSGLVKIRSDKIMEMIFRTFDFNLPQLCGRSEREFAV